MMTPWGDVVGKQCSECGGAATHYYGNALWCCACHAGEDAVYSREDAQRVHDAYANGDYDPATEMCIDGRHTWKAWLFLAEDNTWIEETYCLTCNETQEEGAKP